MSPRAALGRTLAAVAVGLLLCACGAGGGGGSGAAGGGAAGGSGPGAAKVSATRYVTSLCSAFRPFVTDIGAREQALAARSYSTPQAGRSALVGFLSALAADARAAAGRANAAGVPDVQDGREIAGRLTGMFSRIAASLHRAQTEARNLPVGNPTVFGGAAGRLKQDVSTSISSALSGMSGLATGPLDHAAQSVAACRTLS